jgi:hypothetical protein
MARRAHSIVQWAVKATLKDGAVDLAQIGCGGFVFNTYNDAVGMKEIFDGVAFAEKLWIRSDTEKTLVATAVSDERTLQREASARGNGAFLDHKLGKTGLLGDLSGHVLNCGEIRLTALFRWSAHADENDVAGADGFASVRGVGDSAKLAGGSKDFVEVRLENWHDAGIQARNALTVDVRAGHFVSRRGETRARHQSYVATTDHGKMQT